MQDVTCQAGWASHCLPPAMLQPLPSSRDCHDGYAAGLAAESRQQERTMHSLTADLQTYRSQLGMRILSQPGQLSSTSLAAALGH